MSMSTSAKRGSVYLDFDRTLFDVDAMMRPVREFLLSYIDEAIYQQAYLEAKRGGYSFERHVGALGLSQEKQQQARILFTSRTELGDELLFSDVASTLLQLQEDFDLFLLTFGAPELQQRKFLACRLITGMFTDSYYVHGLQTKGQVLAEAATGGGVSYFLDDSAFELQDVRKQAPKVGVVQIARQGLSVKVGEILLDNDWPIVPDLSSFQAYLYESLESKSRTST